MASCFNPRSLSRANEPLCFFKTQNKHPVSIRVRSRERTKCGQFMRFVDQTVSIRVRSRERTNCVAICGCADQQCFNPRSLSRANERLVLDVNGKSDVSIRVRSRERTNELFRGYHGEADVSIRVRSRERPKSVLQWRQSQLMFQSAFALASERR